MSAFFITFGVIEWDTSGLDALGNIIPRNADRVLSEASESAKNNIQSIILAKHIYDTGALYKSIDYKRVSNEKYAVFDGVHYGVYNELGTRRGLPARPFFVPGMERSVDALLDSMLGIFDYL